MIIGGLLLLLVFYILLFKKHKAMLIYIPISKKRVITLYSKIIKHPSKKALYFLYFKIFILMFVVMMMGFLLKIEAGLIIGLILVSLLLIPLVLIWNLNGDIHTQEFNNLIVYLTQLIIIFKTNNNVIYCLREVEKTLSGTVKKTVHEALEGYDQGLSSEECLNRISDDYPHFIVYNLHTLLINVERYGSRDYQEALDLIQDDIDDWSDDVYLFNYKKKDIVKKVNVLLAFAFLICFIALKMLFAVSLSTHTSLYQMTMFLFCLIEITTFVFTQSIVDTPVIEKSETL